MSAPPTCTLPLADVRVLDLGSYISGPCAAVLLAEMGADVVKVEPPAGDPFRNWESGGLNATFVAFNRGKRSVVLDLKSDEGRARLLVLVRTADVLVENFRPGVMERLGIGWEVLAGIRPELVHCSISGFGSSGPYAAMPAFDGVALGYSGLAGLLLDPEDPRLRGPALADAITGHSAAFAVLAALHERHRTGRGEHLEVSMLGALVHFLHSAVAKNVVEGRDETPYLRPHSSQAYVWATRDGRQVLVHMETDAKARTLKSELRFTYDAPNGLRWTQEEGDLKSVDGAWELTDLGGGRTRAVYRMEGDPGRMLGMLVRGPVEGKVKEHLTKGAAEGLKRQVECAA